MYAAFVEYCAKYIGQLNRVFPGDLATAVKFVFFLCAFNLLIFPVNFFDFYLSLCVI